jgi:dTMP kinase
LAEIETGEPRRRREPVAPSETPTSLLALLKRRYFRRLWAVTSVSSLGDWLGVFALTLFVQDLSGRPEFAVGGVLLFRVLPGLFFGPFAGVLADRFDRRRLMITADISRAVLIGSIPWIHNLGALFAISAAMEVLSLLWVPAKDATLPNLVEREQLMTANQLSLITTYGTFPISGALVAVLVGIAKPLGGISAFSVLRDQPISLALFVDAATFLFSASMVATFPPRLMRAKRAREAFGAARAFRDLAEGLRFVWRNEVIRTLELSAWVAFTGGGAVISLGPIFAARTVSGGRTAAAAAWGALIVAVGTGLVSGMITAGPIARRVARERIFPIGLMVSGVAVMLTATMQQMSIAIVTTFFIGLGAGVAWVTIFTLLQERVDDRLRGRTFATLYTGIQLGLFASLAGWPLLAGAVGDHCADCVIELSGVRIMLWSGGVFVLWAGFSAFRHMARTARRGKAVRLQGLRLRPRPVSGSARGGMLVAFEGVEGAGKTTQLNLLREALDELGHDVVVTREPGGSPIAEQIRQVLLDRSADAMDPKAEALLYAASRAQHVAEVIRPALQRGAVVLCDRYIDSSLAYQGIARGLGEDDVFGLNVWATDELIPDLVILLSLDPAVGLARRAEPRDRIEAESIEFHRRVADGYMRLAREYPSRFHVIDSSGPPEQVRLQVLAAVGPFLQDLR